MMIIKELTTPELPEALRLTWDVFQTFEGPDYTPEGVSAFKACIDDPDFVGRLKLYGAFESGGLVGVTATRDSGSHIALFFVRGDCHRQGIGRRMFEHVLNHAPGGRLTVNSSPYAVDIYKKLGFKPTAGEQVKDGIRYTPMLFAMTVQVIWDEYKAKNPDAGTYEAWSFCGGGDIGDELARLVLAGTKTATASAYQVYELEQSPLPSVGGLSIILWSDGSAACIIKTTGVEVRPFREVTPEHAFLEGEDDRSLDMWRQVHQAVFTRELAEYGIEFDEYIPVVCERFEIVWRPQT
jgi:uncharacterized protein YhfF/GNAT superfamily N-acetyltransferase